MLAIAGSVSYTATMWPTHKIEIKYTQGTVIMQHNTQLRCSKNTSKIKPSYRQYLAKIVIIYYTSPSWNTFIIQLTGTYRQDTVNRQPGCRQHIIMQSRYNQVQSNFSNMIIAIYTQCTNMVKLHDWRASMTCIFKLEVLYNWMCMTGVVVW